MSSPQSTPNFKSKFEADVYNRATKDGYSVEYETTKVPYTISNNYIPDFITGDFV